LQSRIDWTDPADVIGAAVARARARNPGRKIAVLPGAGVPLIRVDPVLVEQAIYQILGNALKFSPPQSRVEIDVHPEQGRVSIAVRDEGAGLTADERQRVTERFYRGERHVGRIPGSGLGMWIANTFVTASGGALEITSEGEEQGTTVRIVFPVPPGEPAPKEPGRAGA
jgi:two-component system sensor histidine kinase KdpD